MLDTGMARGLLLTPAAPKVPYQVEGLRRELNPDNSPRGESKDIRVESIDVFGKKFHNVAGAFSDWAIFSTVPFEGAIGLDFFLDRRFTLDYHSKRIAVSRSPLPEGLDRHRYLVLDLIDPPGYQGHNLYAQALVNGRKATIFLDTGLSQSSIDPAFGVGLPQIKPIGSRYPILRRGIPLEIDGRTFLLDDLSEDPIRRGTGFDHPVALSLGGDVLSCFILTIDLRVKKLILARAE